MRVARLRVERQDGSERLFVSALATLAVIAVAIAAFWQVAQGPRWGMDLAPTAQGVTVTAVQGTGMAWVQGIRVGARVVQIDGLDPRTQLNRPTRTYQQIIVQDPAGTTRVAQAPSYSASVLFVFLAIGLTFVLLGAIVYRWSPDGALRMTFLAFGTSVGIGPVVAPAATLGYTEPEFLSVAAVVCAATAFTLLFLIFPRPVRQLRTLAVALVSVSALLVSVVAIVIARDEPDPPLLDTFLWAWFAANLIGGTVILAIRANRPVDRSQLTPIVNGTVLGIAPLLFLSALPELVFKTMIIPTQFAAISVIAVPIGFTYAILRHHLFALDALFRRFLARAALFVSCSTLFGAGWYLLARAGGSEWALLLAALVVGIVLPFLAPRVEAAIDALFYPSIARARREASLGSQSTLAVAGTRLVREARHLVPTRWAAFVIRGASAQETLEGIPRVRSRSVAADGGVPAALGEATWTGSRLNVAGPDEASITSLPVETGSAVLGALVVGPRLDDLPLTGIDREALRVLVDWARVPIEAALLREQAEDEERYRAGLSAFARELAAAGSVEDVLRITCLAARDLLPADGGALWRQEESGALVLAARAGAGIDDPEDAPILLDASTAVVNLRGDASSGRPSQLVYRCDTAGLGEVVGVVTRVGELAGFSPRDERRIAEIAEYAAGALGRAHALAAAAEAERLREINRVRTEIFDMVSHDLQSPLTVIRGFAELLKYRATTSSPEFVEEATESILVAYRSCQHLIDDLLTSARIDKGRLVLKREVLDVAAVLGELVASYQVLPGGERIRLDAQPVLEVWADRARLEQMVGNLVSNALRYAPSGPIIVAARANAEGQVAIEVRDHGPGIAAADLPKVWDKFYRTASGERTTRGSGIGLSVVRTLAELHDGRAEVESVLGQGTTFRLVLPAVGEEPEGGQEDGVPVSTPPVPVSGGRTVGDVNGAIPHDSPDVMALS
jgi:signal transduction histidine kinase